MSSTDDRYRDPNVTPNLKLGLIYPWNYKRNDLVKHSNHEWYSYGLRLCLIMNLL